MKNKLMLACFKEKQVSKVAKLLGFDLRKTRCGICNIKTNRKNTGHFVHLEHKKAVLCDNIICFSQFIARERMDLFKQDDVQENKSAMEDKNA